MSNKRNKRVKVARTQRPVKNASSQKYRHNELMKNACSRKSIPAPAAINPFEPTDDILLVGEGDFSFAASLKLHHSSRFDTLTATSFDTREQVLAKYPQAEKNIDSLASFMHGSRDDSESSTNQAESQSESCQQNCAVYYAVDAKKLTAHGRLKLRTYSKIVFNFPHVGGKSTDVNRQVRHNQDLVHEFLHSCKAILAMEGSILITLFEGEPYSLWNIKDLARSAGLVVKRSFPFDSRLYPGYSHARTLGNLKRASVDDEFDHRKGHIKKKVAWRGEDRSSRTFEFCLGCIRRDGTSKKRKRVSHNNSSTSSDED